MIGDWWPKLLIEVERTGNTAFSAEFCNVGESTVYLAMKCKRPRLTGEGCGVCAACVRRREFGEAKARPGKAYRRKGQGRHRKIAAEVAREVLSG